MPAGARRPASQLQVPDRVISASLSRIYIEITEVHKATTGNAIGNAIWICTLRATLTNDRMLLRSYRLFNDRLPPPSPPSLSPILSAYAESARCVRSLTFAFWRIDRYGCNNRIWTKRSQRDSRTSAREDSRESLGANSKAIPDL